MRGKREFVQQALNHMENSGFIAGWDLTEDANRNDYIVRLNSGRNAVIDLKGCLDGNNINIFERPTNADEFVIWSICTNHGADPAPECLVRHPYAAERGDDFSQPEGRRRGALEHGMRDHRTALSQADGCN